MIEVVYRDSVEKVDLAGVSVAELREIYKDKWDVPAKAKAKAFLNGKAVNGSMETRLEMVDGDRILFKLQRGSPALFLLTAILLALFVTGGAFTYTYITTSSATFVMEKSIN